MEFDLSDSSGGLFQNFVFFLGFYVLGGVCYIVSFLGGHQTLSYLYLLCSYCVSVMTLNWIEGGYFFEGATLLSKTAIF